VELERALHVPDHSGEAEQLERELTLRGCEISMLSRFDDASSPQELESSRVGR
jgi:hypothetical protein